VTDRDLALKVVAEGLDPKQTKIEEVMTTGVQTCNPDDDVSNVLKLMEQYHVRRIPIVDDQDCLVGIIAQADIATRLTRQRRPTKLSRRFPKRPSALPISNCRFVTELQKLSWISI
jgi:predicted transcriptional regulator